MKPLVRTVLETTAIAVGIALPIAVALQTVIYIRGWEVTLKYPWALVSLPLALAVWGVATVVLRPVEGSPGASTARLMVSQGKAFARMPRTLASRLVNLPPALRIVALGVTGLALARPQRIDQPDALELSGIDIVLTLDLSGSMRAADLQPSRIEAAKEVVRDFIQRRRSDRIGIVVFGREAFTLVPPTLDYTVLQNAVSALNLDMIDGSGTAIGDGLGTALNRLRRSDARSKVVVLLTDGANNAGHIDPHEAAQLAAALHVKVYTILVGTSDEAPVQTGIDIAGRPVFATAHFPVDPALLDEIARTTQGQFFRAVDRASLERSFHTILDHLERSKLADAGARYGELYPPLALLAIGLLLVEATLASTRLRRFP